jgi:cellulose synthase/poly-beta-1,6-N-acetylglucosamine synthase-like glycosyltransferase/peptidoglycan/xylan/chitin deacetylase (PgdA/CDA1 family)
MATLAGLSLAILFYIYVGYPVLLALIVRVRGPRPVRRGDRLPSVSLVISAHNEANVIRRKLENTGRLDFPRDLLEVVVVSDASTDGTDEIAAEYTARRGVIVARQPERVGKTVGLNRTVPNLRGEIVVLSDANAMYEPNALKMLVRNFADPQVGCVTGEARYVEGSQTAADTGERAYWDYEIRLKRLETAIGSMVGGDGAIYAIRAHLWKPLPSTAINDFLNPLQIVNAGWRAVYEPDAICYEDTAGTVGREYHRRVRIVSRSWRAVFQVPEVLNPFRTGWFSVSLVSHKLLRWLSGGFFAMAGGGAVGMILPAVNTWQVESWAWVALGGVVASFRPARRAAALASYFSVIQAASLVGIVKGTFGSVSGTWSTSRESSGGRPAKPAPRVSGAVTLPEGVLPGNRRRGLRSRVRRLRRAAAPVVKTMAYHAGVFRTLRQWRPSHNLAILRYHAVCGPEGYAYADPHLCVSPSAFERHVAYLVANYHVLSLPDAVARLRAHRPLPTNAVVLTFDDGYADNLEAARTLHRYGASATFYLTAGCLAGGDPFWPSEMRFLLRAIPEHTLTLRVAERRVDIPCSNPTERAVALNRITHLLKSHPIPVREHLREQLRGLARNVRMPAIMLTWEAVAEMLERGMTIGAHTLTHANLPSAGLAGARQEIIASKQLLERQIGREVTMFSYPNGGAESYYTPEVQQAVARADFLAATTSRNGFATAASDLYALERLQVAERLEDLVFALEVERFMLSPR